MRVNFSESKQNELRRWAIEHTCEMVEAKIEKLRQDAKAAIFGTKHRARLFAVANFLRYDRAIRQAMEDAPGGIWEGDDWE